MMRSWSVKILFMPRRAHRVPTEPGDLTDLGLPQIWKAFRDVFARISVHEVNVFVGVTSARVRLFCRAVLLQGQLHHRQRQEAVY